MPETRTEWAAALNGYDGGVKYTNHGDREYAELTADSVATHLASLNEATREYGKVKSVDLVQREVTVEDDGTQIIRPWQVVRAGEVAS
jgi:hypothetical protein